MLVKGSNISTGVISEISKLIHSRHQKLRVVPNFRVEADYFDIRLGRKVLGNSTFTISQGENLSPSIISQFPDTWVTSSKTKPIKPFLDIKYIELLHEKGKGWARKTMQLLHALSVKSGCEGRMALKTSKKTAGFYSHLGFDCPPKDQEMYDKLYAIISRIAEVKNLKKRDFAKELRKMDCPTKTNGKYNIDGLRFFEPTEQNIALLYKTKKS